MAKNKQPKAQIAGEYRKVPPGSIRPNPANYNAESGFVFSKLVESIRTFGFTDPIVVRSLAADDGTQYEIIGGEHRWKAAQKLGMTEVPILDLGDVSDTTAKQLLITLNETKGSPNEDALAALVRSIHEDGGDDALQALPYTDAQLADLLDGDHEDIAEDDDEAPPPVADDKPAKLRAGDVGIVLELEGASQKDLKKVIDRIRKWRQTKSDEAPCWHHLIELLKSDRSEPSEEE